MRYFDEFMREQWPCPTPQPVARQLARKTDMALLLKVRRDVEAFVREISPELRQISDPSEKADRLFVAAHYYSTSRFTYHNGTYPDPMQEAIWRYAFVDCLRLLLPALGVEI